MSPAALKILFVEDHKDLSENLAEFFSADAYETDFAADGLTALHLIATQSYDIIVLDVMLPGVSGLKICQRIREDMASTVPVLLLTALDAIDDKVQGFGVGADDYLTKPFDMRELELRINALTLRQRQTQNALNAGDLSYNPGTLVVSNKSGQNVKLSGQSATLFETLIRAYPNFVSYEKLSDTLWGEDGAGDNTIRTHAYMLRKQLKQGLGRTLIRSVYGRGYQLDPLLE